MSAVGHNTTNTAAVNSAVDQIGTVFRGLGSGFPKVVKDVGTEISTTLTDTDISGQDAGVQAICNLVWTSSVKEAYRVTQVGIRSEGL